MLKNVLANRINCMHLNYRYLNLHALVDDTAAAALR